MTNLQRLCSKDLVENLRTSSVFLESPRDTELDEEILVFEESSIHSSISNDNLIQKMNLSETSQAIRVFKFKKININFI
jgi:hypothetical protein